MRGLLLWWVTGGTVAAEQLGELYYDQFVRVAEQEGMAGVLRTPFFAERAAQNPASGQRLRAMDPQSFIAVMRGWRAARESSYGAHVPFRGSEASSRVS